MRDSSPCPVFSGDGGSVLLATTVVTLLATALVMGAAYEVGVRMESRALLRRGLAASASAQAGLEAAAPLAADSGFRVGAGRQELWMDARAIGPATVVVRASDPGDGVLEPAPAAGSSLADTVRLDATATVEGVTRRMRAEVLPLPHPALRYAVCSGGALQWSLVSVEGRVRANGNVTMTQSGDLYGDLTTLVGASVSSSFDDTDTDIFFSPDSLVPPALDFEWFLKAGEPITLPEFPSLSNCVITPQINPYGAPSSTGIYAIEANDQNVYLSNMAVVACLVIHNARTVYISDAVGSPAPYYHESPDPQRLPALLVDGDLVMRVEGGGAWLVSLGGQERTLGSGLKGVFACTGSFLGPQQYASLPIVLEGAVLAASISLSGPGTRIRHDPRLNTTPLAQMIGTGVRLLPGSTEAL
ncbi:MAG: hypothetical protein KBD56_07305 [Candidatus Eisenbacteria bacterium]|nr:hypothetical protein [Candidatus Eisenbacteria bacterium]